MFRRSVVAAAIAAMLALPMAASATPFGWVVNAYDLTATSYTYCVAASSSATPTCGTANTNGWVSMPGEQQPVAAVVEWVTAAATSLDYSVECRSYSSGLASVVTTGSLTAAGADYAVLLSNGNVFDQCRIGLKLTTDTGTNSVTAYFATK